MKYQRTDRHSLITSLQCQNLPEIALAVPGVSNNDCPDYHLLEFLREANASAMRGIVQMQNVMATPQSVFEHQGV